MSPVFLFAGPTLFRALRMGTLPLDGITVLPPAKRGDVAALLRQHQRGVIVICDGNFHLENLAVGHAEIRAALATGFKVYGLSSMGAIRAAELGVLGMQGFGEVFARFRDDPDFRDDEVALLHEPTPPYREASEPLFHIRLAVNSLVEDGALSGHFAQKILDNLAQRWFGDRSLSELRELLLSPAYNVDKDAVSALFANFGRHRQKCLDLRSFLSQKPWK